MFIVDSEMGIPKFLGVLWLLGFFVARVFCNKHQGASSSLVFFFFPHLGYFQAEQKFTKCSLSSQLGFRQESKKIKLHIP